MNTEFISESFHIARKDYRCDSCDWIKEHLDNIPTQTGIKFSEWRAIIRAKNNGWKIKKGERYRKYVGKYDGDFFCAKDIPEIAKICQRLKLYYE